MLMGKTKKNLRFCILLSFVILLCCCRDSKEKTIVCWGDSLTAPHNSSVFIATIKEYLFDNSLAYPEHMQRDWADEYNIINAGVGGENTLTIMGRQGAFPMVVSQDILFEKDEKGSLYARIPRSYLKSSYNNQEVYPLLQYTYDKDGPSMINPCHINGKEFEMSITKDKKYYILHPLKENALGNSIKAGSIIETYASQHLRNCYANIFFMGQNGGFANTGELIKQLKAMIDYSGSDRYIVISFHKTNESMPTIEHMKEMEDSMQTAFTNHYINLREYLITKGLLDAGLTATEEDKDSISVGCVPPQLMVDGVHFTNESYNLISNLIKEKFIELGY